MKKKKKNYTNKILQSSDGFIAGLDKKIKPRKVLVVSQRDDDALAISKLYSKKGKNTKNIINKVILSPKNHSSLTKKTVVGKRVHYGRKINGNYVPFYMSDFNDTNDRITKLEKSSINKYKRKNDLKDYKQTKKALNKWKNRFKK